jgi:hypothetical protein
MRPSSTAAAIERPGRALARSAVASALLQNLSDKIRLCYERATEAKERVHEIHDAEAKTDFLNMERRWLLLARSYEFGERLNDFTRENSRRAKVARAFEPHAMLQASGAAVFGKDQVQARNVLSNDRLVIESNQAHVCEEPFNTPLGLRIILSTKAPCWTPMARSSGL